MIDLEVEEISFSGGDTSLFSTTFSDATIEAGGDDDVADADETEEAADEAAADEVPAEVADADETEEAADEAAAEETDAEADAEAEDTEEG